MNQVERARRFAGLHVKGEPLVLFNIWDAGSAKAVADAGAKAIATGSWSVAAAQGYADGEALPLELVERTARQIAEAVELPLTVDFEGGYAAEPDRVADNVARVVAAGAVGINFEDGVVGEQAVHPIPVQCERIKAIRARAGRLGVPLFINARTDLFLQSGGVPHSEVIGSAIERARAYATAGASGFFAPGLVDESLIATLCSATPLPVNVMVMPGAPTIARLAALGVSRVSHGPAPYRRVMRALREMASAA